MFSRKPRKRLWRIDGRVEARMSDRIEGVVEGWRGEEEVLSSGGVSAEDRLNGGQSVGTGKIWESHLKKMFGMSLPSMGDSSVGIYGAK
mgnify:CR=1 FL=1